MWTVVSSREEHIKTRAYARDWTFGGASGGQFCAGVSDVNAAHLADQWLGPARESSLRRSSERPLY